MNPDVYNRRNRINDIRRWLLLDFVCGYKINVTQSKQMGCVQCNQLKGIYPKSFIWTGWHDECKCYLTPILMDTDENNTNELNELRAALRGEEYLV